MGIYSNAHLFFGVPIVGETRDQETWEATPTIFWDEDYEYWRDFGKDSKLEIVAYGHHEDSERNAFLTIKGAKDFDADSWDYVEIISDDLEIDGDLIAEASIEAEKLGLDVNFYEAKWILVASVG